MKAIALSRGEVAIVDDEDSPRLSGFHWYLLGSGTTRYAARKGKRDGKRRHVLMHREIMGAPAGIEVDHRDGDKLNNRRGNLRFATTSQNQANRPPGRPNASGYRGVLRSKTAGKWQAVLHCKDSRLHLGTFTTKEAAARAWDAAALARYGDFAHLNFPNPAVQAAD